MNCLARLGGQCIASVLLMFAPGCYASHEVFEPVICEPGTACDCRAVDMIPAGDTIVGEGEMLVCDPGELGDSPRHQTAITRDYWLGRFEATAACYLRCIEEGACRAPSQTFTLRDAAEDGVDWDERWFQDPELGLYPMLPLTWQSASDYCAWLGGRLPTNAEWERALRAGDGRVYPWVPPGAPLTAECDQATWAGPATRCPANADSEFVPVDTYPAGRGVFGHFHIADNACEWVDDWYDCYPTDDVVDYSGPPSSPLGSRVTRCRPGGRSLDPPDHEVNPSGRPSSNSVRCAFDREPTPRPAGHSLP